MRVGLVFRPGAKGTKKLVEKYGERLICVRYLYDEKTGKRHKTVELVEESIEWKPPEQKIGSDVLMEVRIDYVENGLREKVKSAGGIWNQSKKIWLLPYGRIAKLGLKKRIVGTYLKGLNEDM